MEEGRQQKIKIQIVIIIGMGNSVEENTAEETAGVGRVVREASVNR